MLRVFCITLLFMHTADLWAQQPNNDSTQKVVELKEVCIHESADQANQAFNFYKTSKLASTEDILSRMEGVNLIKRGAYGLEPGIRNYNGGQTNTTIDGMRIYGACTDRMDPVSIYVEPVNLESIQVAHGTSGAQNGSTIGGQINFKLKEPVVYRDKKLHGSLAQSYASVNNAYNTNAALQQQIGKFSYRVSGALRRADNYRAGGGELVQHSGYEKANASAVLVYNIDSLQRVRVNYLGDWGRNIGYPALPMDVGKAVAQIYSLTHQLYFRGKRCESNELKIYYNNIIHQMDDTHRNDAPMHMDMPGWSSTFGFYDLFRTRKGFQLRVDYHQTETRADMTMYPTNEPLMFVQTLPTNRLHDLGLALQRQWQLKHRQHIEASARIDLYRQAALEGPALAQWRVFNVDILQNQNNLLKNVNVRYRKSFATSLSTAISLGYGERAPTSNERYGFYLYNRQDRYDYIGNLALKPERSFQTEWQIQHSGKKAEVSATVFYHQMLDYIYAYRLSNAGPMTIGALGLKTYSNISRATSSGTELSLKYRLSEHITYMGSLKYVFAYAQDGTPLPLVAPLKCQQALRLHHRLWLLQLEYDYAAAQQRINKDYGDVSTPDFHLFNARVSRNIRLGKNILQMALACENIFDARYREHLDVGQIPRFGRSFNLSLGFLF